MAKHASSKYQGEICEVLNRMRKSRAKYIEDGRFAEATGIKPFTISRITRGDLTPELPTIERWLKPFNVSLGQFFADVECEYRKQNRLDENEEAVRILAGAEHLYRLLTGIIENGNRLWINSISGNLYGMYIAGAARSTTNAALPPGVPPPSDGTQTPEDANEVNTQTEGLLRPKLRKKKGPRSATGQPSASSR